MQTDHLVEQLESYSDQELIDYAAKHSSAALLAFEQLKERGKGGYLAASASNDIFVILFEGCPQVFYGILEFLLENNYLK